MDYYGQKLGENIYYFLTIIFGAIAWIVGYIKEDFYLTFWGWLIGLVLSLLICIPDWPIFNKHPVTWLNKVGQSNAASNVAAGSKSNGSAPTKAPKKKST